MDKEERPLTTEAEQETGWAVRAEHISKVLTRPPALIVAEGQDPDTDLHVRTAPPEKEEIIAAIRSLQNGEALRQDSLNGELFKAEPEFAA